MPAPPRVKAAASVRIILFMMIILCTNRLPCRERNDPGARRIHRPFRPIARLAPPGLATAGLDGGAEIGFALPAPSGGENSERKS